MNANEPINEFGCILVKIIWMNVNQYKSKYNCEGYGRASARALPGFG
jgi:hypothetical protein